MFHDTAAQALAASVLALDFRRFCRLKSDLVSIGIDFVSFNTVHARSACTMTYATGHPSRQQAKQRFFCRYRLQPPSKLIPVSCLFYYCADVGAHQDTSCQIIYSTTTKPHTRGPVLSVETTGAVAVMGLSQDGCVRTWNPGDQAIYGFEEAEIINVHSSIFFPEEAQKSERD